MKKQIRHSLPFLGLVFILTSISCGDDDSGSSVDFKDQNLQGTIDGLPYTYGEGFVEQETFNDMDQLSFNLFDVNEEFTDVCDIFGFGEEVSVFFNVPNATGLYELSFDFSSFSGQVVTLFNPNGEDGIPQNNIASTGAIEILTISETQVTGRIDARIDGDNTVNGNFTAVFCQTN